MRSTSIPRPLSRRRFILPIRVTPRPCRRRCRPPQPIWPQSTLRRRRRTRPSWSPTKAHHLRDGLKDLEDGAWKSRIAEKKVKGVNRWRGDEETQRAVYNNRTRLRSGVAKEAFKLRAELVERSFALTLDRGGMRRAWLRGRENLHKRYLVHVAGYNLGLIMRLLVGAGTPREFLARVAAHSGGPHHSRGCHHCHPRRRNRHQSSDTRCQHRAGAARLTADFVNGLLGLSPTCERTARRATRSVTPSAVPPVLASQPLNEQVSDALNMRQTKSSKQMRTGRLFI